MNQVTAAVTYLALGSLIGWRIYARFRRMVGRQRLSRYRAPITLGVYTVLTILVALPSRSDPVKLLWLLAALLCGAALGHFGLRRTRFEAVAGVGFFYTPHAPLGIALSLLFVARIALRVYEVYVVDPVALRSAAEFARSPLTLSAFGLLAGYYTRYALGLALWRARVLKAKRLRDAAHSDD